MTRLLLALFAVASLVSGLSAAPVPADVGKGVNLPYPAKAPVVVCLNGYDTARERLQKMVANALPDDAAKLTKLLDANLNKLVEGRKLTAVRKDARIFLVLNDLGSILEGSLPASVLVPVTSYKEFRETALSKEESKTFEKGRDGVDSIKSSAAGDEATLYLVDLKEYVALTPEKGVADLYAMKYTPGSIEPMGKDVAETFLKADVAVYVNMDAINEQFGDKIRQFTGFIDFGIQQAQQQGALPGLNKKQLEAMKVGLKGLFQGVEDCRAIVVAGEFLPEGLRFQVQGRFADNTPSAKLIETSASQPIKEIGKLPKGMNVYSESRLGETLSKLLRDLSQEFAAPEEDEKSEALLEVHLKERAAAGLRGETSSSKSVDSAITISNYKEPAKAVDAVTKLYKDIPAGGRIGSVVLKSAPKVSVNAEKYKSFTFSEIRIHFDFDATVASLPEEAKEFTLENLKRTLSEKTTLWIGTDGQNVIQLTGKDWASAKSTLETYLEAKQSVGDDKAFKAARDFLPADASVVMMGETASTIKLLFDSVASMSKVVPGFPQIGPLKPIKSDPTYLGMAVTLKGDVIGMTLFIPTGSITVGRKLLDGLLRNVE